MKKFFELQNTLGRTLRPSQGRQVSAQVPEGDGVLLQQQIPIRRFGSL